MPPNPPDQQASQDLSSVQDGGAGGPAAKLDTRLHSRSDISADRQEACPTIPDHQLLKKIGDGSYGEVWLARSAVGTLRAVKIVYRRTFWHDHPFEREFKGIQKFEPISRSHEGFVDILQIGRGDGCFYYVMELADDAERNPNDGIRNSKEPRNSNNETGTPTAALQTSDFGIPSDLGLRTSESYSPRTLTSELQRRGRLPVSECLEIGLSLTSALGYLHQNGLVHRDVKPANIIFVGAVPKLADIGLVAEVAEASSYVGTEGFIPPEGPGRPQADLYSMGKSLYEISTGKDRHAFPELPPDLVEQADAQQLVELNAILLKACQNDPRERYQSAEAMHADLECLAGGMSVRRAHPIKSRWRVARQSAKWVGFVAFGLTLLIFFIGVWQPAKSEFRKRSTNSVANDLYDIGRTHYQKNIRTETAKAAEYFQAAINADTNFALAQAALAACWCWPDNGTNSFHVLLPRAKKIAESALAKDDSLSEAHLAVAMHGWIEEWNWPKTEKHFRTAIKCDPQNSQPHEWYGIFLRSMGRTNEAIQHLETAVKLNPQSYTAIRFFGNVLFAARRYSEAAGRFEKAIEVDPNLEGHANLLTELSEALLWDGRIDQCFAVSARAAKLDDDPTKAAARTAELNRIFHKEGAAAFWRKGLEFLREDTSDPIQLAGGCAMAGQTQEALDLLERAYREHNDFLVWDLKTHPQWDSLRSQRRFKALLKRLKLE